MSWNDRVLVTHEFSHQSSLQQAAHRRSSGIDRAHLVGKKIDQTMSDARRLKV